MPKRFSTVRGREFGDGMRAAIAQSGMTARKIAELLAWQEAKVSDVVTGKGGVTRAEVVLLLGVCRVKAEERDRLLALFPVRNIRGWWRQHGRNGAIQPRTALTNLAAAESLIGWEPHVIPVLLRTESYMRELLAVSANVPEAELQPRLSAQREMAKLLSNGQACMFFIHEFALHLQVGGIVVLAEQIHHLMLMANWNKITIRIVPAAAGAHAGVSGPFTKLMFETYQAVVWIDTENSSLFVEGDDAVEGYDGVVQELSKISLSEEDSLALIIRLLECLREDPESARQPLWDGVSVRLPDVADPSGRPLSGELSTKPSSAN